MSPTPSPLEGEGESLASGAPTPLPDRLDRPSLSPAGRGSDGPVTLAAIIGAHGVTGEVRLKLFGDGPDSLRAYKTFDAAGRSLTLKTIRPGPNGAVARFVEIADRNAAEALRGVALTVPRSALPPLAEGEYYHADLIGLVAVSTDGGPLGVVVAVENFGAGDVIEIERPAGKRFMVPMRPEAVPEWDDQRLMIATDFVEPE